MKEVDLVNPHRSLTTFISVALNEFVKQAKILLTITEKCLNPESPQEPKKNYFIQGNLTQSFPHGPVIFKVMQRNVWSDIASWRTKRLNSCTKSQLHALTTINSRKKNLDLLENCQTFVRLHLASIGIPDILWSVNKFARAVTKWTRAGDKR